MRSIVSVIVVLIIGAASASAQMENKYNGHGYVFAAPGGIASRGMAGTLHFGGGGEAVLYKGFGIGAEIGYLSPARSLGDGFGLFSVNGLYHFRTPRTGHKLAPFVTAGYSLAFRSGTANMFNFGGGVHYWFSDHAGLRAEFRDYLWSPARDATHYWGFRFGLALR